METSATALQEKKFKQLLHKMLKTTYGQHNFITALYDKIVDLTTVIRRLSETDGCLHRSDRRLFWSFTRLLCDLSQRFHLLLDQRAPSSLLQRIQCVRMSSPATDTDRMYNILNRNATGVKYTVSY